MQNLSLALRNLLRNPRRCVATLLAMVIGMLAILVFNGYVNDLQRQLQTDYVQRTGHLQIQHADYRLYGGANPTAYGISGYQQIIDQLRHDAVLGPMIEVATPSLQFDAVAGNFSAGVSRTVRVTGMVVEDHNRMRQWNDYRFPAHAQDLMLTGSGRDAAVIGTGLARILKLCASPLAEAKCSTPRAAAESAPSASDVSASDVSESDGASLPADVAALASLEREQSERPGDASGAGMEILASDARGAPNVTTVNVLGAEDQGVRELNDVHVLLHLQQAQGLIFGGLEPRATAISLQLAHTAQLPAATARLRELFATTLEQQPLDVVDFPTLNPFYRQSVAMFNVIFGFIAVLIGTIVLFTVSNTMSMVVIERTMEIGTLRALGMRRTGIGRLFVSEGLVLGLAGALLGVAVSLGIAWLINHAGWTWTIPGRVLPTPLSVRISATSVAASSLAIVLIACLSAIWPAVRASRMNIVGALHHA